MKKVFKFIALFGMVLFSGCISLDGGPEPVVKAEDEIPILKELLSGKKIVEYLKTENSIKRNSLRNQIVSARLYATDLKFSEYVQGLAKELRGSSFGVDITSLLLTGTASVITQGTATRVLAGLDTALKGGQQSFSKNILIDKTLDVLLTQMRANRKRISTQIWINLKKDDNTYSLPIALSQLEEYYQAGTISGALISISDSAVFEEKEARKEFERKVIGVKYGENNNTKLLNNYVDSAIDTSEELKRLKKIQGLIKVFDNTGDDVLATELIDTNKPEWLPLQNKVVNALELGGN